MADLFGDKVTSLEQLVGSGARYKGLLRHGAGWWHLSRLNSTIILRRADSEEAPEERHDRERDGASLVDRFRGATYYGGWPLADAADGITQIERAEGREPAPGASPPRPADILIPQTRLRSFYAFLRDFPAGKVHTVVAGQKRAARQLAALIAESLRHLERYDNQDEHFGDRGKRKPIADDADFARALAGRLAEGAYSPLPSEYDFELVSREVNPLRTTGSGRQVRFEDGRRGRSSGGGGIDVLLRSRTTGRPIIGEIKAEGDSNAFLALVQALTYATELVTANQRRRLVAHMGFLADWAQGPGPYADIYIFLEKGDHDLVNEASDLARHTLDALRERLDSSQPFGSILFLEADISAGPARLAIRDCHTARVL